MVPVQVQEHHKELTCTAVKGQLQQLLEHLQLVQPQPNLVPIILILLLLLSTAHQQDTVNPKTVHRLVPMDPLEHTGQGQLQVMEQPMQLLQEVMADQVPNVVEVILLLDKHPGIIHTVGCKNKSSL
jgi:hypothetical protein